MIIVNANDVIDRCSMCGKDSHLRLTDEELEALKKYLSNGGYIQECLPSLNKCEREFIKSGYCPKCQELIFGNGKTKRVY